MKTIDEMWEDARPIAAQHIHNLRKEIGELAQSSPELGPGCKQFYLMVVLEVAAALMAKLSKEAEEKLWADESLKGDVLRSIKML